MKRLQLTTGNSFQVNPTTSTLSSQPETQITFNAQPIEMKAFTTLAEILITPTTTILTQIAGHQLQNTEEKRISLSELLMFSQYANGFPSEVNLFIDESGMPDDTADLLIGAISKISDLLKSKNLQHRILTELFVDYEYPEWKKIKLRIIVHKDLSYLYDNVKYPIYDLVDNIIPPELSDKILIKLESYKEHDTVH